MYTAILSDGIGVCTIRSRVTLIKQWTEYTDIIELYIYIHSNGTVVYAKTTVRSYEVSFSYFAGVFFFLFHFPRQNFFQSCKFYDTIVETSLNRYRKAVQSMTFSSLYNVDDV